MPQQPSWRLEGGGQVLDLETAVKDGILGGGGVGAGAPLLGTAADKLELKKMIEELESSSSSSPLDDDIPSVFICPISLEPMTDPVTLCTGQTYERANILRWFSTGHLTCPTTMQSLWDDTITPNTTLHHLTLTWFSHRYLHFKKRADDVQGRAADLLSSLRRLKGQPRVQSLKDLHRLVAAHPSARLPSAAPQISSLLGPFTSHAVGSEAVGILVHLPLDDETKSSLSQPARISLVVDILNEGTIETKINCTKLLTMLVVDDGEDFVVSSLSLVVGLLRLIKDKRHPDCTPAGLTLLHKMCVKDDGVLGLVISVGAVPHLVDLLLLPPASASASASSLNPECLECALHVLDRLSTLPQGRTALKDCPHTITHLVRLLMRVSEPCTHYALSILWEVCKLAPDECASMAVEAGLAAKLLLVIQSGCEPALKQRSAELLKLCSLNYTATLFISKCKLTRTIQ